MGRPKFRGNPQIGLEDLVAHVAVAAGLDLRYEASWIHTLTQKLRRSTGLT